MIFVCFVKYADNKYISQAPVDLCTFVAIRYRLDFATEYITSSSRGRITYTILDMLKATASGRL